MAIMVPLTSMLGATRWDEREKEVYTPQVGPALREYFTGKYGEGKAFEMENAAWWRRRGSLRRNCR